MTCMFMYVFMSVCVYLYKHRCIYPLTPELLKNIVSADSQLSHCQSKSDTASPCILGNFFSVQPLSWLLLVVV